MHPLWASSLGGLYLGQNSPSRLKLGRHLSLITIIFLFGLRKWNYYSALSPPTSISSKVYVYSHMNCELLTLLNKMQEYKDFSITCEELNPGIWAKGLILSQATARSNQGNHCIHSEVGGEVRKASAVGLLSSVNQWGLCPDPKSWGHNRHHIPPSTFGCSPRIALLHIWPPSSSFIFTHQQGWRGLLGMRGLLL